MQEFTTPGKVDVPADDNVVTALVANGERFPQRAALAYRSEGRFVDVSTAELVPTVRELAAGLISLGIEAGSRVCVFMPARIEFTYLDYAIWAAGCATVTIYETSSADQVEWIVSDSGSVAVICGSQDQRKVYDSVAENLPGVRFRPTRFMPTFHKWAGRLCGGVQIHPTDPARFKPYLTALADGRYRSRVVASTSDAHAIGVSAVPAFLLDGRLLLVGAYPHEVFEQAFDQLARLRSDG